MYYRILIPVDGSRLSIRALEDACALAKCCGGAIRVVHSVTLEEPATFIRTRMRPIQDDPGYQAGDAIVRDAVERCARADIVAEDELLISDDTTIGAQIVEAARRWNADLIAMGTHGRSGLRAAILGSVAADVLQSSQIPVLLVPDVASQEAGS
jgi:nucleotide-binding universal stress UspA family protein